MPASSDAMLASVWRLLPLVALIDAHALAATLMSRMIDLTNGEATANVGLLVELLEIFSKRRVSMQW
jgi:hypothetical protein